MNLIEAVNAIKDTDFKICRKKRNPDYDSLILDGDCLVRYSGEDPALCLEDFEVNDWYIVKECQENIELKPCPFCGGEGGYANGGFGFIVKCRKCGSRIDVQNTTEEAVEAWNTRPLEDAKDEEIRRLRNVLEDIRFDHPACFDDSDCPHNGGAGYDNGCLKCPYYLADEALKGKKEK